TAWRWRKEFAAGGQFKTPGSRRLHAAASERGAAKVRGRPVPASRLRQVRKAAAKARSRVRRGRWDQTGWTRGQRALLGTDHDEVIAKRLGRSANAVALRRVAAGIPPARDRRRRGSR